MLRLTIEELLSNPEDLRELARHLEYSQSIMVAHLKHEPELLEKTVAHYETLYLLRKAIETYKSE